MSNIDNDTQSQEEEKSGVLKAPNDGLDSFGDDLEANAPIAGNQEGVLEYAGKKYAVGLFWLVGDEEGDAGLVRRRAKQAKADFYCVRDSVVTQHGFGTLKQGHRMGMPSAASYAADMLVGEWHAVFRADNGWWYMAVHGDAIAPDGDRFFTDEEEAFNFFREENERYKWPRVYAPEDWDVESSTAELSLERMLDQAPPTPLKAAALDAVFAGRRNKLIAGVGFLCLIGLAFIISLLPNLILSNIQEPPPIIANLEGQMSAVKAPPKKREEKESIIQGVASINIPRPSAVVVACGEAISRLMRPLPGWDLFVASCVNGIADVRWRRDTGSVDLLMENVGVFPKGSSARLEGDFFIGALQITDLSRFVESVKPMPRVEAVLELNRRLAGAGELDVAYVLPPAPPPEQGINIRAAEPPPQPPAYLNVVFKTKTPPQILASYFDVDGLEMVSMEWDFQNGTWTYTAKVNLDV